jgi:hypothetical protein
MTRRGFRVAVARTPFEAIVKASCNLPDLILVDASLGDAGAQETSGLTVDLSRPPRTSPSSVSRRAAVSRPSRRRRTLTPGVSLRLRIVAPDPSWQQTQTCPGTGDAVQSALMSRRWAYPAALAQIVLLGAALRLFPIWFGLPYPHARPDEETTLGHAMAILAGDPNPHFFNWPSLTFYVLAGCSGSRPPSCRRSRRPATSSWRARRSPSRGRRRSSSSRGSRRAPRIARRPFWRAGFLSVAVLHVRESHFALTDVLMTLLVTASLAVLVEALETGSIRQMALAGLLGGLATSTKYNRGGDRRRDGRGPVVPDQGVA